ncbi:proliferation-associated protein 2G4-like [Bolinopsis microptera]|uniref:proliferation-associated protein 2G4-like n=1 Tax=Bolinopsis microptera TaxID=2820187 RepID=UPI003078E083
MADLYDSDEEELTIENDAVLTKYKTAGEISNLVLKAVINEVIPGANVIDICSFGDKMILDETAKHYKKDKSLKKGIAFPTCICVNEIVCHFSPLRSDPVVTIKEGDLVKIELGVHIDGYAGVGAHSVIVGSTAESPATGEMADAVMAAHYCAEAALRLIKAGNTNEQITEVIQKITAAYNCSPLEGMLSYEIKRYQTEGATDKQIVLNPNEAQKKEIKSMEFAVHEVYAMDVFVTPGSGKMKESNVSTTVHKRSDETYLLKMKASRAFFSDVCQRFTLMPFTLRAFEDEKKAKMGLKECVTHELVHPYPVQQDTDGKPVAQFKYTVLVVPNGNIRINGGLFDSSLFKSEHKIEDKDVLALLAQSANRKAGGKKKKKKAKSAAEEAKVEAAAEN